jgi:hypothetical protein
MSMWTRSAAVCAISLLIVSCSSEEPRPVAGDVVDPPLGPELSENLSSGCYDWPEQPFSTSNPAQLRLGLQAGQLAVEFELPDLDGKLHKLSELLIDKPVLLVTGSFT